MATSEDLNLARKKLFDKLGDTSKPYTMLIKQWFSMKINKEEFDQAARKIMTPEQTKLHNEFLLCLITRCSFAASSEYGKTRMNGKKAKNTKQKRVTDKTGFQPADPVNYLPHLEAPPQKLQEDAQRFSVQEYFLPDESFILGRLMLGAWELGMKGADENSAKCLVTAVQFFLKNILTAVITMRKGFRIGENKFIHSIGEPVPNPWLRHTRKRRVPGQNGYHKDPWVENDEIGRGKFAVPHAPLNESELEQRQAFELACATSALIPLEPKSQQPISAYDLLLALMMHKSSVPAHSIYAHNMERIICTLNHPTWEELEAAKHFESFT